jgi:hypothetical protein
VRCDTPSDLAIFAWIFKNRGSDLSREPARYILTLRFDEEDQRRMANPAERNQEGRLSSDEHVELDSFAKAGELRAFHHLRASTALESRS